MTIRNLMTGLALLVLVFALYLPTLEDWTVERLVRGAWSMSLLALLHVWLARTKSESP
jgi:hypothetical protein